MPLVQATLLQVIGKLHDEDAILGHESDERDESNLAVDIDAGGSEEGEEEGSRKGQRDGSEEDDEGVSETLKLGCQHEEDQDDGEDHCGDQGVALLAELARLAGIVDNKAARQDLCGPFLQNLEGLVDGDARGKDGGDLGRIKLLEALDLARFGAVLQFSKRGELQELLVGTAHVDGSERIRVEAVLALELGDDLVASPLDTEAVHVVASKQCAQVSANLLQVEAKGRDLVAVKGDLDLRLVVLQIAVGKDEDAACEGCFYKVVGCIQQPPRLHGRGDDNLDGEVAPSGQGWWRGGDHAQSRNVSRLFPECRGELLGAPLALAPGHGTNAAEASVGTDDLEGVTGFGK